MNKKRLFKHLLCLLSLFGFLISCQTEEVVLKQFGKDIPVTKKQVRYLDSKQSRHISAKLATKFNKPFGKNDTNNFTVLSTNVGEIDLTKVLEITNEFGVTNYTYLVKPTSITLEKFYNIVYSTSDDKEKIVLVEYLMTDEFKDDYYSKIKTISQFKGTITSTIISNSFPCTDPPIVPITDIIDGGSEASNYPSDSSDFNPISGGGSPINNPGDIINDQEPISGGGSTGACYWEVVVIECSGGLGHNGSQVCYAEFKGATYLRNSCTGEMIRVFKNGTTKKGENSEESDGDMGDPCPPADGIGIIEPSSAFMSFIFSLPTDLKNWLTKPYPQGASQEIKDLIENYVNSANADLAFAEELVNLAKNENDDDLSLNLINLSIITKENGYFENSFDSNYYNLINPYTEVDTQMYHPLWGVYFTVECARARYKLSQEPGWNDLHPLVQDARVFWAASSEMIHLGLELIGLVPVVGEVADLTNGVIYAIEGEGLNATLSIASAIPFVGWYAAGIKMAKRADGLTFLVKASDDLITFGAYNSAKFRQALGLMPGDPRQAHHLIPRGSQIIEHEVVQRAAQANVNQGFHIDQALNGIPIAAWRNQPNHPNYNNLIRQKLVNFLAQNPNATPQQCYTFLTNLIQQARQAVINNPNVHLNNLNF